MGEPKEVDKRTLVERVRDHFLPRKRNVKAARIRFKDLSRRFRHGEITVEYAGRRVNSFIGYMKHCDGMRTTESTLKYLRLTKEE